MIMKKRIFVKTITRELTLFTFEIWHKAQQNAFSTALLEPSIAEETGRYDIFAGSGTALQVARHLGRNFLGIELSGEYIKIANDKLKMESSIYNF